MELSTHLRAAKNILIFTGAGISTGSGIPDYRGPNGVWKQREPVLYEDFMASEEARVKEWGNELEGWNEFRNARPNAVHHAIAKLERAGKICMVVTQNIDGLHRLAGTSADRLVEIHGTNSLVECQTCGHRSEPDPHFASFQLHRKAQLCECGGFLKLATIAFGQNLDAVQLFRAQYAALEADLVIALGSTLCVQPAATLPLLAADRGVPYIIINRGATEHDAEACVTFRIEGDVTESFPPAVEAALA